MSREKTDLKVQPEKSFLRRFIDSGKERSRVRAALIYAAVVTLISFGVLPIASQFIPLFSEHNRHWSRLIGFVGGGGILLASMIYPINLVRKRNLALVKPVTSFLAKAARQWHVMVALLLAIGASVLHSYLAVAVKFQLDVGYLTGIALLVLLGIQVVTGLYRYKKLDRKWHLALGLSSVILLGMHIATIPKPNGGQGHSLMGHQPPSNEQQSH